MTGLKDLTKKEREELMRTQFNYRTNVLDPNKRMKEEKKKLGVCVSILRNCLKSDSSPDLSPEILKVVSGAKNNQAIYKIIEAHTRANKWGNYSAFGVLQQVRGSIIDILILIDELPTV
jgi:hypothetical protein